ncbi:MAG: glucose 1-dehydrogenase [Actinomycetota bacterium]|nr:glucose 1-dehydrogenase [Actinomycetota bacterium]
MKFENKVAVVTGAGSGIGEAIAHRLADDGASVVVTDIDGAAAERVAGAIQADGGAAISLAVDVANADQVQAMVDLAVSTYGGLHLAANNAGMAHQEVRTHEMPEDLWSKVFDVNVKGAWLCMRAEITQMLANGGGAIVNTASAAGLKAGPPGLTAYTASKHALVGLTRCSAMDYIKDGIRINAVAPGTTATAMIKGFPAEVQEQYAALMPCGRMAEPAEMAAAVAYLLSDDASYVTGTTLEADMGFLQK